MKSFFIKFLLIAFVLIILALLVVQNATYSDGERTGNILNISRKGVIIKTWEGKLDLGIYQGAKPKTGNVENTVWEFSVANDKVAEQIQEINKRGNKVVLHYEQKYVRLFWNGDTPYIVTEVEEIPNSNMDGMYQNQYNTPNPNIQNSVPL